MRTTHSFQSKKGIHDIPATSPISIIGSADYIQKFWKQAKNTRFYFLFYSILLLASEAVTNWTGILLSVSEAETDWAHVEQESLSAS